MTAEEMRNEFRALYNMMASSNKVENMHVFGNVHKEMMEWFIVNKPDLAQEWLDKLESIRWCQYLTPKEADKIIAGMDPKAPWSREQWKNAMESFGLPLEEQPCYNKCALYVTMSMIMSDSSKTLSKYAADSNAMFEFVHALALDKLKDVDKRFDIRHYFNL
jgi:hypothetical protein